MLPLEKPSALGEKVIIQKLMALGRGLTGKVATLLTQAAELAIRGGSECISAELIDQAAENGIYSSCHRTQRPNACKFVRRGRGA